MWEESVIYQPAKVPWDSVCTPASWKTIHPQCRLMVNESDVWRLFRRQPYRPKNYRSADSAYAILIKEYATDSLRYAGSRINRALNMALMTDNIAILEEEVELTKKIFPKTWKGPDSSFYGKNKKDFFDKCFNVRKSNPACYIKKITNHCIWKNRPVIPTFNTKTF